MAATLESSTSRAPRGTPVAGGTISVFDKAGKVYGRIGVDPAPLCGRNPSSFGVMVPRARSVLSLRYREVRG